ncbi:MAG: group 1 truncated hemoglobin [Myxococcales bacterium]|nr:group 1 truncated hemoglobin [Myxococcales bacterium]
MNHYERLGGDDALRAILADFYDRVFADPMIGFMFQGLDKARLVELERQFTARVMGADVAYEGRGMRAAHARHPVTRGHFRRRLVLLRQTLEDHDVAPEIIEAWLAHAKRLEAAVLGPARADPGCDPAGPRPSGGVVISGGGGDG